MKYAVILKKSYTDGVGYDASTYEYRDFIEFADEEALKSWYLEYLAKRYFDGTLVKVIQFEEIQLQTDVKVSIRG